MVVTSDVWAMQHHSKLFAKSYGLEFVPIEEAHKYKDVYQLGIFSDCAYENLVNRTEGRVVLHWCGSDAFNFEARVQKGKYNRPLPSFIEHVSQSQRQIDVLKKMGINARLCLRFCDRRENYPLTALPEKYSVLIFTPHNGRNETFNYASLSRIIEACPDIHFTLFGQGEQTRFAKLEVRTPNITRLDWISLLDEPEKYRDVLKNTSVQIRFKNKSEGFSQMVMQTLLLGRRVLSNIDQEYVERFSIEDEEGIAKRLRELKDVTEPHIEAAGFYHTRSDINCFDFIN